MLTELKCRNAEARETDWKLSDSGGLHLLIKKSGYKSWRMKYRFGGKEKQLTFGPYPLVSLKKARLLRDRAKLELLDGRDPKYLKPQAQAGISSVPTFETIGRRWFARQKAGWKPKHAAKVLQTLERDVFPQIGHMAVDTIRPRHVRAIVDMVQERGAIDQAHRIHNRILRIFKLAIAQDHCESNPAASIDAILQPVTKRKYRAFVDLAQAKAALKAFEAEPHQPMVKLASRLLALTASRPGPLRMAEASEFHDLDGEDPRWIIPAAKLKLGRSEAEQERNAFTIPLAPQAVATVRAALVFSEGRRYLFPSTLDAARHLSDNALGIAYRRCPAFSGHHVPHGWRSTFATIMNERAAELDRPGDRAIIDLMLAHQPQGVESRYNRATYMTRRRALACEWAELLTDGLVDPVQLLSGPRC